MIVDVVIPVYRGLRHTRRCIESVLESPQVTLLEVVAVDDATPEPAIAAYLDELAAAGRVTVIRNDENLGFVRSVNRAMSLHPDRDVVLLNSDTEVANDWLDRLHASAYRQSDVGTVTPFSNNATICSYPFDGWTGGVPGGLGLAALDRMFAAANAGGTVNLPTAVGFCMLIRRDCLAALGLFDADRFGRGYGEENDFCMRAGRAGWRHVLAADVFVFHEGSVSFAEERGALLSAATDALLAVHPDYLERVRDFIIADPARELRSAVDGERVAHDVAEARHVLAERREKEARLHARLWETDAVAVQNGKLAAERDELIGRLNEGLAHATALVHERDAKIAALEEEISKLRAGLHHAETLAFARADELDRIHALWAWKYIKYWMPEDQR